MFGDGRRPILSLDFDGVCHSYTSGWQGATVIPDPPVPGLFKFLLKAAEHFDLVIFSSRSHEPGGADAMAAWYVEHWKEWVVTQPDPMPHMPTVMFPYTKPAAFLSLDDRGLRFEGVWPEVTELLTFKPWHKR